MKIFEIVENTQVNDLNQLTVSAQQGLQKVKQGDMRGALSNMEQIANGLAKLDVGTKMYNFMSKMLSAYEQQVANFPEDPDTPKLQKVIDQIQAQMPTMQKQAAQSKQYAKTARNKELDAFGGIGETASAGSTSAGAIASVANPVTAHAKVTKKGKYGAPKAPQKTNPDGTAKNALDMPNNIMGGKTIKR